ncbi:MAG TPA: hypothetical protein VKW08_10310 [Xanthobacteraceae bacterium]|nr:hypothetical protein [Xanthobacteraceae bacterium]
MIRGFCAVLGALAICWPQGLLAQTATSADEVKVGDRWVYESKDESTGYPKDTYTFIVTSVSNDQIVTSMTVKGKTGSPLITFGRDWSVVDNGLWTFKPNSGQGIPLPLAVGKEWHKQFEAKNNQSGAFMKGSIVAKVVAQESITTSAGTFDTFKVNIQEREFNTADPSKSFESEIVTWFAPQVNRWVRRTTLVKSDKRTRSSTSEELADFSRDF